MQHFDADTYVLMLTLTHEARVGVWVLYLASEGWS